ncbi:hypothetical protein C2845_PM02G30200 [Panicum miliaceum]|uniref:Protein kinase domain-containing protein n=1 Tax=Panicum miliaceum TaxID=4540 RepID=A0A3L6S967_PANMI|nr:hypothetical protein C2845_PM02G30200 [Panicum miliaceum]
MGNCAGVEGNAEINPSFSAPDSSGTGSKSSSKNATDTSTFGTKTSGSSSSVPPTPRTETEILESSNVRKFTFSELKGSTRNFRPDSLLGEGGFGSVFKGWMDERTLVPVKPGTGMIVAVKKLKLDSFQGHREWLVALEAARGLAFLHGDQAKVIYRDFKTSNILLDSEYNAKLSDFGLAKDGPSGDKSHVSTRVMGTQGYAAPEYLATGHLTAKSDVYSYGVVLLELLSGQRALDKNRPPGQHNLVEWARPYITNKRRVIHVLDSRLGSQYSLPAAQKTAALALQCLSMDARCRPGMDQVVTVLEGLQETKGAVKSGK